MANRDLLSMALNNAMNSDWNDEKCYQTNDDDGTTDCVEGDTAEPVETRRN